MAHFARSVAAPAVEFNARPPMEINYRSQLGRFPCDEWARRRWLGEIEVSLASPLRPTHTHTHKTPPHANKWLSLYIRRVRYAKITTTGELALTLKADEVAGLFGLPSDDAQAVVQAQDALDAEMTRLDFPTGTHVKGAHSPETRRPDANMQIIHTPSECVSKIHSANQIWGKQGWKYSI